MNYLIQIDKNNLPIYDGGYHLIKSIEYQRWYNKNNDSTISFIQWDVENKPIIDIQYRNSIPIGSVEFVQEFYKQFHGISYILPMNIPRVLVDNKSRSLGRKVHIGKAHDISIFHPDETIFVKSNTYVKGFNYLGKSRDINLVDLTKDDDEIFLFSQHVDIHSEWRCFVFQQRLVGMHNYSGDFTIMPDQSFVKKIIHELEVYNENDYFPPSYTIDVALDFNENQYLIEMHDFYSCGHYGFNDYRIIPQMYSRWHHWFINAL